MTDAEKIEMHKKVLQNLLRKKEEKYAFLRISFQTANKWKEPERKAWEEIVKECESEANALEYVLKMLDDEKDN